MGDTGGEKGDNGGVPSQCLLSEVWRIGCRSGTGATISEQSELRDVHAASCSERGHDEKKEETYASLRILFDDR